MIRNLGFASLAFMAIALAGGPINADQRENDPAFQARAQACAGLRVGQSCTFAEQNSRGHQESITGICGVGPDGVGPSVCLAVKPAAELRTRATAACKGVAKGNACSMSLDGQNRNGICRGTSDPKKPLVCVITSRTSAN